MKEPLTKDDEAKALHSFLNTLSPLSGQSFSALEQLLRYRSFKEGETFIKLNQPNQSEFIILRGICRSFLVSPDGEEVTLSFFQAPAVLSPHITRTKHDISNMNFQAITQLDVAIFEALPFVHLMIANMEVRNFANTILKDELLKKIEKEIGMASLTAKERLIQFRHQHAMLENLIPHPLIASYLGITNISLSRLRGEMTGK